MTATRFSEVPRRRRVRTCCPRLGEVAGFEIQRFPRTGHVLLFVWQQGDHGCPLIAADLGPRERQALIRLLGGTP